MNLTAARAKAASKARETGEAHVVATIDHEEGRRVCVYPLEYAETAPEFEAFEGKILAIVEPDGAVFECA